jgi:hypothetical protein
VRQVRHVMSLPHTFACICYLSSRLCQVGTEKEAVPACFTTPCSALSREIRCQTC